MSAISRATLRQTIRNRGDYTNTRRFSNDYLNTEIQNAFGKFYQLVSECNEGWWDTTGNVATVASQAYVALPTDCWTVRAVDRLDGTDYVELLQIGIGERNRYGSTTGKPNAYRLSARGAELYATPDAAYTLRVTYTPKAPDLTESATREWYNGWEDYVIEETLLQLDKREQRPLGERMATLDRIIAAVKSGASQRRRQEPEYLNLRESGDFDPYGDGLL